MEATRTVLTRLTSAPNDYVRRQQHYYNLDRAIVNEYGDTALHRLLAAHAGMDQLDAFLHHHGLFEVYYYSSDDIIQQRTLTSRAIIPTITHVNCHGVHALHVAVFRNSFQVKEIVHRLLQVDASLARIPIPVTRMYPLHIALAYSLTIEMSVIEMLLEVYPPAASIRNVEGMSCLDLLTVNVQRFRWARSSSPALDFSEQEQDYMYMTIISPFQYMRIGMKLLHAMGSSSSLTWHSIAREAPVLLLLILLQEQKTCVPGFWTRDEHGQYPLHCSKSISTAELLLLHAPSTNQADTTGRWPLHQVPNCLALAMDAPEALVQMDPRTGLFPFQLAAMTNSSVDTIYTMLRMNPSVI